MKRTAAVVLALSLLLAVYAFAQPTTQSFPNYVRSLPQASLPLTGTEILYMIQNGESVQAASLQLGGSGGSGAPYQFTPSTGADQHNLAVVSATPLTVPGDALFAQVCVSGAAVNWTWTGTAPTALVGQPLAAGACEFFSGRAVLTALQFIQKVPTAVLDVTYSK